MLKNFIILEQKKHKELGRNLTVNEYNELMENSGCKKIWFVEFAIGHRIYECAYLTEEEARAQYNKIPETDYRKIFSTLDVWGYTERLQKAAH